MQDSFLQTLLSSNHTLVQDMSSNPCSVPVIPPDVQSLDRDAAPDASANRRLEDRVAEFLQSFESNSSESVNPSRFGQNISSSELVDGALLTQSTVDPVQTQPQVFNLEPADSIRHFPFRSQHSTMVTSIQIMHKKGNSKGRTCSVQSLDRLASARKEADWVELL